MENIQLTLVIFLTESYASELLLAFMSNVVYNMYITTKRGPSGEIPQGPLFFYTQLL